VTLTNPQPRRSNSTALVVVCCLLSIISMTAWVREDPYGPLHRIHDGFTVITTPLQQVGYALTSPVRSIGDAIDNNNLNDFEIDAIIAENERLRAENIQLREYEHEARSLSELLDIKTAYNLQSIGARIISRTSDSWNRTITINRGTDSGVRVGMPVVSANGIIGRVESAGPSSAVVRLINDQSSTVAVYLQVSRAEGTLQGSPDGTLFLNYIDLQVNVEKGMTIVTSGLDGVYPKGIPVGTVQSVEFLPNAIHQTITIRPISRVGSYEEVFVITGSEPEGTLPSGSAACVLPTPGFIPICFPGIKQQKTALGALINEVTSEI